jgi:hypothetical protein
MRPSDRRSTRLRLTRWSTVRDRRAGCPSRSAAVATRSPWAIVDPLATAPWAPVRSPMETLADVLAHADRPLTLAELRHRCHLRTAHVCQALTALTAQGRVHKTVNGYQRAALAGVSRDPFPVPPTPHTGNGNG